MFWAGWLLLGIEVSAAAPVKQCSSLLLVARSGVPVVWYSTYYPAMDGVKVKFDSVLSEAQEKKSYNASGLMKKCEYEEIVNQMKELEKPEVKKTQKDYRLLRKYDVMEISVEGTTVQKLVKKGTVLRYVCSEDLFDAIKAAHLANGHGGRNILSKALSEKFANITIDQIKVFLQFCEECQLKKSSVRKSVVVKPILSNSMNSRCQVDLIDMQSQQDGEYRFILNYQDHLTKFVCLRPLKTKTAEEVAYHLVDIFCDKGAPHILQSDNGREFCNKLITEVLVLWPGCKLVHGKPRHSQSQGSVERANKDVEAILACWQKDYNTTKWSEGLRFVQWQKNTRFHRGIGRTPYEAMFGQKSHLGVTATNLPEDVVDGLETEEQLAEALAADNIQDSTTSMCKDCGGPCSMDDDICHLCERKLGIQAEREGARRKQHSQAEKMQLVSTMRFKKAEVGDSVMVPIPLVDRGRAEFPNAKAVVLQVDDSGTCKLGTRHGILKQLYSRNQFTPCEQQFLSIDDVPQEKEISLREVANADSVGHGQGFIKCTCSMSCNNNRCKCFKKKNVCNSRCKCGSSCKNK